MAPLILLLMLPNRTTKQPANVPDRQPIGEIAFLGYKGLGVGPTRLQELVHEGSVDEIISAATAD